MILMAHTAALLMAMSQPDGARAEATVEETASESEPAWPQELRGTLSLRVPGQVQYHIGYGDVGFGHSQSDITLSWVDDGARSQTLFNAIHDMAPGRLRARNNQIILTLTYCTREEDRCHDAELRYRYDARTKQFVPINAAARAAIPS